MSRSARFEDAAFALHGREYYVLELTVDTETLPAELTGAERIVLRGILSGLSARCIARNRGTSDRTVRCQTGAVYEKLQVSTRAELLQRVSRDPRR